MLPPDCPQIISRCHWGAKPYNGAPMPLSLPLQYLFIHHTYEPSSPCLSFPDCSRGMRSMQRFHQEERGWSDIGYRYNFISWMEVKEYCSCVYITALLSLCSFSFVVGSDGYVYEGAGWNIVGKHTRNQNSVGYGVSIIGNYTAVLPSRYSMDLVRRRLVQCALDGGRLVANFTIHGHRQAVNYTTCPGDAFFSEISRWEHFRE